MASHRKAKVRKLPLGRYIRQLTLENIRTFRSPVTLDFCHPDGSIAQWTVILGENGTGKTTLLQYLAGMMPVQDKDVVRAETKSDPKTQPFRFRPFFSAESWIGWHIANLPQPWTKPMAMKAHLEISQSASSFDIASDSPALRFGFEFGTDTTPDGRPKISMSYTGVSDLSFYEQFRIFGYGAGRHVAGPSSPYLTSDAFAGNGGTLPVGTLFHDDQPLISPEQWLLSLDHSLARAAGETRSRIKQLFTSALRCLTQSLPDIRKFMVKPYGFTTGQTPLTLLCKTPFSVRPVPFNALSVGYRTMAAWLTDFIKRMHDAFPTMLEPDNGPAVVLIDEFDLHLHPKWQREAMAAISKEFPNTQFIVTVHSPLVVQATEGNARIIVLRRKTLADGTEEIEAINEPHYSAGWRIDQILASDLYDLPVRSPRYAALMDERTRLRQKSKRRPADEKRLAAIEKELDKDAPPESAPGSDQLFAKLEKALDRAEGKQKKG
jgi:energy-coupling factor transporter ATP-binding protein EcfA2